MVSYNKVTINCPRVALDAVSEILVELSGGVQLEDELDYGNSSNFEEDYGIIPAQPNVTHVLPRAIGYFADDEQWNTNYQALLARLQELVELEILSQVPTVEVVALPNENWENNWKKYYHPVKISRYLTIVPAWEQYSAQDELEHVIYLDPGMSFGTGDHPTTKQSLQALELIATQGMTVIDVGTGSGILSLAARDLGAKKVVSFDLDPTAVHHANENFKLNQEDAVLHAEKQDLLTNVKQSADLILANILAEVIMPLIPQLDSHLNQGGHVILSGIINQYVDQIKRQLHCYHFEVAQELIMGDWHTLIVVRQS